MIYGLKSNFGLSLSRERDGLVVRASGYGLKGLWFKARSQQLSWPSPHPCVKGVLSIAKGSIQRQTSTLSWGWVPPVRLVLQKPGISTRSMGLHGSKRTNFGLSLKYLQSELGQGTSLDNFKNINF